MKKSVKIILAAVMAVAMCAVSFYFGMKYEKREYDLQRDKEYADKMRCGLTSLSELLTAEKTYIDTMQAFYDLQSEYRKFDKDSDEYKKKVEAIEQLSKELRAMNNLYNDFSKEYIQSILSSLHEVRILAESTAEYTNDKDAIARAIDFSEALQVLCYVIGDGLTYDGDLICYAFTHYNTRRTDGEREFLQMLNEDVLFISESLDFSLLSLSDFSSKYSTDNIIFTLSNFELDKGEYITKILDNRTVGSDDINNYPKGEVINLPILTIHSPSEEIEAYNGTCWWNYGNMLGHGDSLPPIDILASYEPELYLYKGDIFRLSFNIEPTDYTIYELKDDGTEIKTNYKLHEYIKMQANDETAKYLVRAKWEQGGAFYTFQIGLIAPIDLSDCE